jgi:hypothetical protein
MDRSWINANRLSAEYEKGMEEFFNMLVKNFLVILGFIVLVLNV